MEGTKKGKEERERFLDYWNLDKVKSLNLEDYNNNEKENAFCYWIESKTTNAGSIWGGSSYKFGIYKRANLQQSKPNSKYSTDGEYGWYTRYGGSKDEAWAFTKEKVVSIVEYALEGKFQQLNQVDFGEGVKWKIAYLFNNEAVLPIYKKEMLETIAHGYGVQEPRKLKFYQLQQEILKHKDKGQDNLDFAAQLWNKYSEDRIDHVVERFLNQSKTEKLTTGGYPKKFKELDLKISFGTGNVARVPWIAFLKEPNKVQEGIYPVLLLYKDLDILILSYGVSSTNKPMFDWNLNGLADSIEDFFSKNNLGKPVNYGESFVFKHYDLNEEVDFDEIDKDVNSLIEIYKGKFDSVSMIANEPINEYKKQKEMYKHPLNQILYGPPGTGKTYSTILKSCAIIRGITEEQLEREVAQTGFKKLKEEYDEYVKNKDVVFTTFHQSTSYEDFIEGIKPNLKSDNSEDDTSDDLRSDGVDYTLEKGVFRQVVTRAEKKTSVKKGFDTLWGGFYNFLTKADNSLVFRSVESELRLEKEELTETSVSVRFLKSFTPENDEGTRTFKVSKNMIERLFEANILGTDENKLGRKETAEVLGKGRATYAYAVYKSFFKYARDNGAFTTDEKKNYVLIIDEINRGNVSAIFGELITLLEPTKRLGQDEELKVTLPYSKDEFGVPSNLHIIGTMNTADRSVEALDTALRRRFDFTEMPPKPELIKTEGNKVHEVTVNKTSFNLVEILKVINRRIEVLLDRDHLIGHSFFMKVTKDVRTLKSAFSKEIIPLLQEYFYGDYGKISLVLGTGFCEGNRNDETSELFADVDNYDSSVFNGKMLYIIHDVNYMTDQAFEKALNLLLKIKSE